MYPTYCETLGSQHWFWKKKKWIRFICVWLFSRTKKTYMVLSGIKTSQKIPDREIIHGPSCPILCESYNPPMCCENPSGYWPHFHFCCLRLISDQAYCCIENTSKWKGSSGMIWFRYSKYSEAVWHGIWIIPSNIKMQELIKI